MSVSTAKFSILAQIGKTMLADGTAELVARYAFETDDGAMIEINNYGFRHGPADVMAAMARGEEVDPSQSYMRPLVP